MINKLVLFLLRKKFHLKKYEHFKYTNQKDFASYYFGDTCVMKHYNKYECPSHVSINWLLNKDCKIKKVNK